MPTKPKLVTLETLKELWPFLIPEERAEAFSLVSREDAHSFFQTLPTTEKFELLINIPAEEARIWIRALAPDDATDVIQAALPEQRESLVNMLDDATRREVSALLAYAEDEAGGLMNPRFARVRPDTTADVALRYVRRQIRQAETVYYIYVLDSMQRLSGVLSLRQLFAAPPDSLVSEIMVKEVVSVPEDADQEAVAQVFTEYDLLAVPVVDAEGRMRGIITVDDIVDVVEEEATEDIQKIGGTEALGAPYLSVGFTQMIRKRGLWLSVLFLGEMLTATALAYFHDEIAKAAVVLTMFVPLIISSGGNSGSQASTLVIRALALQELQLRDWLRVLAREFASGATLGFWLGAIGFIRVVLWQRFGLYDYGSHPALVGLTVWASLIGVVSFGTLAGSMLPFLLRRLGLDPATSSAPFVATLVDVTGLVIYFGTAAVVLHGTIL